ncbi:MAG: hypothetical protein IPM69_10485 [Ignavibacteria bacterium]|nr:hypothetical protein [Ignavibacteria bacterium]
MHHIRRYILVVSVILSLNGCLFVKQKEQIPPPVVLNPQPELVMSDNLVRSKAGDVIALLPVGWFFVELEGKAPSDIFAIAVNPDYTLSAVFSTVRKVESSDTVVGREGVYALARMSFARHERKTAGNVRQVGKTTSLKIGSRVFGNFEITGIFRQDSTAGAIPGPSSYGTLKTKIAVFESSLGNYYEFALVPTTISGKQLPTEEETSKIFRSILTTFQF